jgi:hypothetical protein
MRPNLVQKEHLVAFLAKLAHAIALQTKCRWNFYEQVAEKNSNRRSQNKLGKEKQKDGETRKRWETIGTERHFSSCSTPSIPYLSPNKTKICLNAIYYPFIFVVHDAYWSVDARL